ncbi:unnamed protein product [Linum trigynum]|uniref:Uncharacterized protein n=1 Tax=Linum trigynum TaxID=586398 RepID=A0AAV2DTU5_9ROSI
MLKSKESHHPSNKTRVCMAAKAAQEEGNSYSSLELINTVIITMSWLRPEVLKSTSSFPKKKSLIKRLVSTVKKKLYLLRFQRYPCLSSWQEEPNTTFTLPTVLSAGGWRCSCHQFLSSSA